MLDKVKTYLRIIGNDEDDILNAAINRGQALLNGLTGVTLDFNIEGLPQSLLLDYCRYSYNNASEYFEENFHKEILRLQLQSAVIANAEQV